MKKIVRVEKGEETAPQKPEISKFSKQEKLAILEEPPMSSSHASYIARLKFKPVDEKDIRAVLEKVMKNPASKNSVQMLEALKTNRYIRLPFPRSAEKDNLEFKFFDAWQKLLSFEYTLPISDDIEKKKLLMEVRNRLSAFINTPTTSRC